LAQPNAKDTPVVFVCGRRRSGKSAWVKRYIAKHRRLLIWDYTGEYGRELSDVVAVYDRTTLIAQLKSSGKRGARLAFFPKLPPLPPTATVEQRRARARLFASFFDWFCRVALAWGNCTVVVEELASVTQPGKAPQGWGDVIRLSGHAHLTVVGVTQRPAEIDKTIIGNASLIHYCPLARADDLKYMARELRLPAADLDNLPPLHWIDRDTSTGKMTFGKLPWA